MGDLEYTQDNLVWLFDGLVELFMRITANPFFKYNLQIN